MIVLFNRFHMVKIKVPQYCKQSTQEYFGSFSLPPHQANRRVYRVTGLGQCGSATAFGIDVGPLLHLTVRQSSPNFQPHISQLHPSISYPVFCRAPRTIFLAHYNSHVKFNGRLNKIMKKISRFCK